MGNEYRAERVKPLKKIVELLGNVSERKDRNFSFLHDTLNNLAIVAGGVAAGALVLLSSNVALSKPLVLFGVVVLFVDLAFYFVYKISSHVEAQGFWEDVTKNLEKPIKELVEMVEDETVSEDDFNIKFGGQMATMKNWMDNDPKWNRKNKIKKPEAWCYWIFVSGLFLIGAGLLWPYLQLLI